MASRLQQADIERHRLDRERALEVDFWKARCKSVKMHEVELRKERTALSVKLGQLIQTDQKLGAKDVMSYQSRILALEQQIHDFHQSERLAVADAPSLPDHVALDVERRIRRISGHLQDLFEGQELYAPPKMSSAFENSQFQSLFTKVFNVGLADSTIYDFPQFLTKHTVGPALLRSLSAAALAEWVFCDAGKDILFDRYNGDSTRGLTSRYARALKYVASRGE